MVDTWGSPARLIPLNTPGWVLAPWSEAARSQGLASQTKHTLSRAAQAPFIQIVRIKDPTQPPPVLGGAQALRWPKGHTLAQSTPGLLSLWPITIAPETEVLQTLPPSQPWRVCVPPGPAGPAPC